MIKSTIKYSILCGVFLIGLFFISINFGSNPLLDMRHFFFDLGVFFLFIYFSGKEFKDYRNDGYFHFWQGISIGFIVMIPAVLIFSTVFYFVFEANPELLEAYKEGAKAMLIEKKDLYLEKFSEGQYQQQLAAVDEETTARLLISTFWKKIIAGFLITPVVGIILRKKPK
ncbi:DUF4199 domain-containing protein [Ekhidna sp.]|uniref:DUF4199 domain-containing protein n=1 Tax=Ekhidna sp. TaxID=2608089 RepID=UPI0032EB3AA3